MMANKIVICIDALWGSPLGTVIYFYDINSDFYFNLKPTPNPEII